MNRDFKPIHESVGSNQCRRQLPDERAFRSDGVGFPTTAPSFLASLEPIKSGNQAQGKLPFGKREKGS